MGWPGRDGCTRRPLVLRLLVLALLVAMLHLSSANGYLGIDTDTYGLYYTPPRALESLRSDYQFVRDQRLQAGGPALDLTALSQFGGSMQVRLDAMMSNATRFSLELSVLGGASTVAMNFASALGAQCTARKIVNNSIAQFRALGSMDRPSSWASWSMPVPFGTGLDLAYGTNTTTPEWCRALCCANHQCSGWTYTDPQFSQPSANMCWLYQGIAAVAPGGPNCDGSYGHCWGGLGNPGEGRLRVDVDGERFIDPSFFRREGNTSCGPQCRPVPTTPGPIVGDIAYTQLPPLSVFVDGGQVVQVYFNGMVTTKSLDLRANETTVSLAVKMGQAMVKLQAWRMDDG
eukprot:COSAG02_NODE_2127_length_9742_cov_32.510318_9_plen_345_part_00